MSLNLLPLSQSLEELFTLKNIIGFIIIGLINAFFMALLSYNNFRMIQQTGYRGDEYRIWILRKDNSNVTRLFMLSMLSTLGFFLINMAFSIVNSVWVSYAGFIIYIVLLIMNIVAEYKKKDRTSLVLTKRLIRLIITFVILTITLSILLIFLINFICILIPKDSLISNFRYFILCFCPIFVPWLVLVAYYINSPYEKRKNKKYLVEATNKLKSLDGLIKIGITGSYAKTTLKEILTTILSVKYSVLATPKNYNTPLGISKTVKRLNETHEVFIAEMGARRQGEIKELCRVVNPEIAVITGITSQHLETFYNLETIKKTKYELVEYESVKKAFFSCDNEHALTLYEKCPKQKFISGLNENKGVYATNIKCLENGTHFTLNTKLGSVDCYTQLIGKHNVSNICLAVSVCLELNLTLSEIAQGIDKISQINHRLELSTSSIGVKIIDDGYNGNIEGVKVALDTLKLFGGKKYVVTPGLIELGIFENSYNFRFGEELSAVADFVVLVGRAGALHIREGLLTQGYDKENIIMVKNLEEAKIVLEQKLKKGDTVLFENDLPDRYL